MNIKINGETATIDSDSLSVTELLKVRHIEMPEMVSVELNGSILDRDKFDSTQVKENDEIEFLYFMGGGS